MNSDPEVQAMLDEAERELAVARVRRARVRGRIPARVVPLLDAGVRPTACVEAVRAFVASQLSILVLAGGVGSGKTVAACEAVERAGLAGSSLFVKALDLVRAGTFDEDFWREVRTAKLLVVDDLGVEPLDEKGWALANLLALIDARYDDATKTILTTNLDADRFLARYGADGGRLRDRMREAGQFFETREDSLRGGGR